MSSLNDDAAVGGALQTDERTRLSDVLWALRAMVRRRWKTFLLVSLALFAGAAAFVAAMPPRYEAVAQLRIDPSRNPLSTTKDNNVALTSEAIDTEVSVVSSPELARDVVQQLRLTADPEFNPALSSKSDAGTPSEEVQVNATTQAVLGNLRARRDKLTYIIAVAFTSKDPAKSARIANAFAQRYIDTRVGSRSSTAGNQARWIAEQLAKLNSDVRQADERLAQYRAANNITATGTDGTVNDQQIGPLSTQLASAQSEAAAARAKLSEARRQVAAGGIDALSESRESLVVADLRRQRAEVLRSYGEISARYGQRHPESIKAANQLSELDRQLREENQRAVDNLVAEADAAGARAASLAGALGNLRSQQSRDTRASAVADSLERDAETKREAQRKMAQLGTETQQSARNVISNAEIINRAEVPLGPAAPRKSLLFALSGLVAVALGFGVVTAQELFTGGLRTASELEDVVQRPVLAALPRQRFGKGGSPAETLLDQPASIFAEALRNAKTSILNARGVMPKVIAITSALPEEGKTTTALSLARVMAITGTRTLLIDCDLRKASVRELTSPPQEIGLVEVLRGDASAEQAIFADVLEGVDVLMIAQSLFTVEDLFGSGKMTALLDKLRDRYDAILLDLPPLIGLADARTLATLADTTVLVVRWNATPARAVDAAMTQLRADQVPVAGAIYTRVDPRSEAIGGLFYSRKYGDYYKRT